MKFFVKTFTGKQHAIEMDNTDSVEKLKAIIEKLEGVKADSQKLITEGNQL